MKSIAAKGNICSNAFLFNEQAKDDFDNLSCSLSNRLSDIPKFQELSNLNEFIRDDANSGDTIKGGSYEYEDSNDLSQDYEEKENYDDSDSKCRDLKFSMMLRKRNKPMKEHNLYDNENDDIMKHCNTSYPKFASKSIKTQDIDQTIKKSKETKSNQIRAPRNPRGNINNPRAGVDRTRIDVINKRLLRGFRKVVFKFAERITNADKKIKGIVKELKQTESERSCLKSRKFVAWMDEILNHFKINENTKEELFALLISFIFKTKIKSILGKINDHNPKRFNIEEIKMKIKTFKDTSNYLTARTRVTFLAHPVIRLGKTLFSLSPDFQTVFWKSEPSSQSFYAPMSSIEKEKIASLMDQIEELKIK